MTSGLAKVFVLVGFILLVYAGLLVWKRYDPNRLNFQDYRPQIASISSFKQPRELRIKRVGIRLPLIASKIEKNTWETTDKGASYLSTAPIPGSFGNAVIYGHNWPNLLGRLVDTKTGDEVEIVYADGSTTKFVIETQAQISPNETHVLQNSNDTRLTIYTCIGFFDSQRFVVVARALDHSISMNKGL